MQPDRVFSSTSRVLDVGPPDQSLGQLLADRGITRYLGLVEPSRLAQIRAAGPLHERIHPLNEPNILDRSSTDVVVVRAHYARLLWGLYGSLDAKFVALERGSTLSVAEAHLAALFARFAKRARNSGSLRLGDHVFDVFEVCQPRGMQPRMYFSPVGGPSVLAGHLAEAGFDYVVLRWFEDLPRIAPGEDLDILVADSDLSAFRALVASEPGTQPLDLYSVSGLPYSDFRGAAYYPPSLAREILDHATLHNSGFRVPASTQHFRSLAYHAVYHKGLDCGLPSENGDAVAASPEHDYASHLTKLAEANGIQVDMTMEGVDRHLISVGWRPPDDAVRRLTSENGWLTTLLDEREDTLSGAAELAVFLIRASTPAVVSYGEIRALLDHFGFDTLLFEDLNDEARSRATTQLRGGNWGMGPFPQSGGIPVAFVAAVHHSPVAPYPNLISKYPHLTNAETFELKEELRRLVEVRVPPSGRFNPIHSSDNSSEAWQYLEVLAPDRVPALRQLAEERARGFKPPENLIRSLSMGRRARVDVVKGASGPVVRKTFVPAFQRFLEREADARVKLSPIIPAVPALGAVGPNWIETPLYDNLPTTKSGRPLPLPLLREMVEVLRSVHALGYDIVDAKPGNFLVDASEGLKLIDLEFLHEYEGEPPPFAASANFVGPWQGFEGDIPVGDMSYESRWLAAAGMPVETLADGTVTQQHLHRALSAARRMTIQPGSGPRRILRRVREFARHRKWLAQRQLETLSLRRISTLASPRKWGERR